MDGDDGGPSGGVSRRKKLRRQDVSLTSIVELNVDRDSKPGDLDASIQRNLLKARRKNRQDSGENGRDEPNFHIRDLSDVNALKDVMGSDFFTKQVKQKMNACCFMNADAELEVLVDWIVEFCRIRMKSNTPLDVASIQVIRLSANEVLADRLIIVLLQRGVIPTYTDDDDRSALHWAVQRGFIETVRRLLDANALTFNRDRHDDSPLSLAMKANKDDLLALLIYNTPQEVLLRMCCRQGEDEPQLNPYDLLENSLRESFVAILDKCMYNIGGHGVMRIHYQMLEADSNGRVPTDADFDWYKSTVLHMIAKKQDVGLAYHEVVRLLVGRKWRLYGRRYFASLALSYTFVLLALSFIVVASSQFSMNPNHYTSWLDFMRLGCELLVVTYAGIQLIAGILKAFNLKTDFYKDPINIIDLLVSLSLLVMVPIRLSNIPEQWALMSITYFAWCFGIFKYACVFRQTGAYVEILWRILVKDFPPFIILFIVFLVAFSGSLLLSFRGEGLVVVSIMNQTSTTDNDIWMLAFQFLRIAVEGGAVTNYTTYRFLSLFLMFSYICICLVVLMNVLIAQLSDTYNSVYMDAQRGFELNRVWIIRRIELNSLFWSRSLRLNNYLDSDHIRDPWQVLDKYETSQIRHLTGKVIDMDCKLDDQEVDIRSLIGRQANIEKLLNECLVILQNTKSNKIESDSEPASLQN